jgi:hypothetical protein
MGTTDVIPEAAGGYRFMSRRYMRLWGYVFSLVVCIVYAMAYVITMQQNMLCIGDSSIGDGDQDDCVLFRYDSEMKRTTPHEHRVYMYIFTLSFIASIMSFIIVWLIDLQTHVNGFIHMVTKVAKTQVVMDFGFFLVTMAFSLHRRHVMGDRIHMDKQVYPLYVIGTIFVTFGDCATQLWSLVICLVFVRIARDGLALDVKTELPKVANIIFGVSSVFALLEATVCWDRCWILSGCIINYIRAIFSVLVIVLSAGLYAPYMCDGASRFSIPDRARLPSRRYRHGCFSTQFMAVSVEWGT